jgi:hypothetical protein
MSAARLARLAERKAQLVTQSHVDRARLLLAVHQLRQIVSPAPDPAAAARLRPAAAALVNIALPLLGMTRLGRLLRVASLALTTYRVVRSWYSGR